jgi:hypothetical protein
MSSAKGNNPDLWNKLLETVDEKLQLGLLDHLRHIRAYHFEASTLYLDPGTKEVEAYFKREGILQTLKFLAQDAIKIEDVQIKILQE